MNGVPMTNVFVGVRKAGGGGLAGYHAILFEWGGGPALDKGRIPDDGQNTLCMNVPTAPGHHKLILLGPHGQTHTTHFDGTPLLNWHTWKTVKVNADSEHWFEFTDCPDIEDTAWQPPRNKALDTLELKDFKNYEGPESDTRGIGCSHLKVRIRDQRATRPDHVVQVRHHDSGWITRPITATPTRGHWSEVDIAFRDSPATAYIHVWQNRAGNVSSPYTVFQVRPGLASDTDATVSFVADGMGIQTHLKQVPRTP